MLINKIFHLHQPLPEARQCLRELGTWSGCPENEAEVRCSLIEPEGIGRFEVNSPLGQRVSADIQEVPGDDPNRILFRSVGGNIELAGIVELFPIRPNLTEVSITLDYEPVSPLQKVFGTLDRFLNRQLARIEGCMERARTARETRAAAPLTGKFA
jgi:uncharacterized membrane protein